MDDKKEKKNLELERLVFFSDAIIAIAITLLALTLKIDTVRQGHLSFADFFHARQSFAAFILSFFIIAVFWKIHHQFFFYINKIDSRLLWYNIAWLLFIVLLPFTSSLISTYLFDTAAIFAYSINVFFITLFQNGIWDYVAVRPSYLNERANATIIYEYRLSCNVAMVNALLATGLSFLSPLVAFAVLFTRLPMITVAKMIFKPKKAYGK